MAAPTCTGSARRPTDLVSYYFAYGSNMNPARMQARGLRVEDAMAARLPGYALSFDKRAHDHPCLLYTSPSPRDVEEPRMPSSA